MAEVSTEERHGARGALRADHVTGLRGGDKCLVRVVHLGLTHKAGVQICASRGERLVSYESALQLPATAADGCGPADTGDGGVDDAERGPLVDAKDSEAAAEGGTPVRSAL